MQPVITAGNHNLLAVGLIWNVSVDRHGKTLNFWRTVITRQGICWELQKSATSGARHLPSATTSGLFFLSNL
jgi:hypothetical protein